MTPPRKSSAERAEPEPADRELASAAPTPALRTAWGQIVEVLALGPAPELRECPTCHEIGMRAATRCSRCWSALPRLDPAANS